MFIFFTFHDDFFDDWAALFSIVSSTCNLEQTPYPNFFQKFVLYSVFIIIIIIIIYFLHYPFICLPFYPE